MPGVERPRGCAKAEICPGVGGPSALRLGTGLLAASRSHGTGYEIRYALSMTCGAGGSCMPRPLACGSDVTAASSPVRDGGVIAAPTAALRFNGGRVTTQRLTISLRIR